jgi:4-amino-4-deoxy-L-arabinose transferase-like glycosyltransferase
MQDFDSTDPEPRPEPRSFLFSRVRLEWLCIAVVVAAAFVVRVWGLSRMHFWDENVYLLNAEYIAFGKAGYLEIDSRPPLLSLLFAGVFELWHSDYAAAVVTALLNAFGPLFLYLAGRRIVGRIAAAIAALLLAFGPFFVGACPDGSGGFVENCNGHSLLTDCPALTLLALSLWLLSRALEKQTSLRFACAGFSLALPILMRFGSISVVGVLALLVFAADRRVKAVISCAAGFLLGIGPYLCWSRIRYDGFFETLRNGWANLGGDSEPFFYYLRDSPTMLSWLAIAGLALWLIRRACELIPAARRAEFFRNGGVRRLQWEGFLWLWAVAVMIFFSILDHKEPRYAMPFAPPLLLLAGAGLAWLVEGAGFGRLAGKSRIAARTAGGAVLAGALLAAFWPIHHRFDTGFFDDSESEEMAVSRYLRQNLPPSTILYANLNYPDLAYYSGMKTEAIPEGGDDLYKILKELPADGLLIAYKPSDDFGDIPPEPPLSILDSDPHYARLREFPSMVIYKYHAF